jgi:hypothetical protein
METTMIKLLQNFRSKPLTVPILPLIFAILVLAFDANRSELGTIVQWALCLAVVNARPADPNVRYPKRLEVALKIASVVICTAVFIDVCIYFSKL